MIWGLPDLGRPLRGLPGEVYAAHGRNGLHVVIPDRLELLEDAGGAPQLRLSLVRRDDDALRTLGRLELGITVEAALAEVGAALARAGLPGSLAIAELDHGELRLETVLGGPEPTALMQPRRLTGTELGGVRVVVDLDANASVLAEQVMRAGDLPLYAGLTLAFRAVAPRLSAVLGFEPRRVAEQLESTLGAGARVGLEQLGACFERLIAQSAIVLDGPRPAADAELLRHTLALRLSTLFTQAVDSDAGVRRLIPAQAIPVGRERVDLSEPAVVLVSRALTLDPLARARAMLDFASDDRVRLVASPPIPTGLHRLEIGANLIEPVAGLLSLFADFRAPSAPPWRLLGIAHSVSLGAPERRAAALLKFAPGEPLSGEARLRALILHGGEVAEIIGPWCPVNGSQLLLGPIELGVSWLMVHASRALTALAVVEISAGGQILMRLDTATRSASVPLLEPSLGIVVRPVGAGRAIEVDVAGRSRVDLDLATLPGFGAHHGRLIATDTELCTVEWCPEEDAGGEPLSTVLGAGRAVAEIAWLASSPFRPGMVWRVRRAGAVSEWSAPVLPAEDLEIRVPGVNP